MKILFLDLDGTLLRNDKNISNELNNKLFELKQKGVIIVIITGRAYNSLNKYRNALKIDGYVVAYNGAKIYKVEGFGESEKKEVVYENELDEKIVTDLINISREKNIHLNLYKDEKWYVEQDGKETELYHETSQLEPYLINFDNFKGSKSTKGIFISDNEILLELYDELKEKLENVHFTFSRPYFLEILNADVNKGSAVKIILDKLNIDQKDAYAFGDEWNDYEMLSMLDNGYLMGNAPLELKEKFPKNRITLSNDEDGVLEVLNSIKI